MRVYEPLAIDYLQLTALLYKDSGILWLVLYF